jgi:hypothetical protein
VYVIKYEKYHCDFPVPNLDVNKIVTLLLQCGINATSVAPGSANIFAKFLENKIYCYCWDIRVKLMLVTLSS